MKITRQQTHDATIIKQFTQQAIPFTALPGHFDSIQMLIELSNVTGDDLVLDVASGPGMVTCAFARIAKHVTGIDLTEKMIEQAKNHQDEMGLTNLSWKVGTATPLPYASDSFDIVISRYSFHHFLKPESVLKEMVRVCKADGVVLIADVALPADKVDAYNQMEKLRDPSHTLALSYQAWEKLLEGSGLRNLRRSSYKVDMELEGQLKASFPNPGDDDKIRDIFKHDLHTNALGLDSQLIDQEIHFSYPISIYVGNK